MGTTAVARSTFDRLDRILPDVEIAALAPVIDEIEQLKRERNAVLLAHVTRSPSAA
jgi:quinolinate synthase